MHYEILNLAAMSCKARRRLGLKSCAQFLRGILRAKFQMPNPRRFRAEFLRRSCAKFNEILQAEPGAPKPD